MAGEFQARYLATLSLLAQSGGTWRCWQLARTLTERTLLAVYEALERPMLFAIGNRYKIQIQVQNSVDVTLSDIMAQAEALFIKCFGQVTLDQLAPEQE
ncbi:hypothetical protein Q0601_20205 [Paracoccus onubensis]|uniref:hypothetical protein n=1 Tax=Paracoccus onubensis TaxID=1675788 RepID=UPI002730B25E|nr:hypothetical protein [Paracoccus onubensis]MDP0929514.1 hypothetical protein [Paracoccus onubensis]